MKAKRWILAKHFDGKPKDDDLKLVEEDLSDLKDNEVLLRAMYLSVDPYMRIFSSSLPIGSTMIGEQVAEVIETKNDKYPLGSIYLSQSGWRTHFKSNGSDLEPIQFDLGTNPVSLCLGTLGMPGATAYAGLIKLCKAKKGEIVLVNGAAGAVGSCVGQLAKLKGCVVIAFAGSDEKCNWLKSELGFDHVFNYKKVSISESIDQVAPHGVDVFFDNVGGDFFNLVVTKHMNKGGRVGVCGCIETYNEKEAKKLVGYNHKMEWPQMLAEMSEHVREGRLKCKETIYNGFDQMREAFYGLFRGDNTGKAIVKVN